MDDIVCQGTERDLFHCNKSSVGTHNCGHSEDAGVICSLGWFFFLDLSNKETCIVLPFNEKKQFHFIPSPRPSVNYIQLNVYKRSLLHPPVIVIIKHLLWQHVFNTCRCAILLNTLSLSGIVNCISNFKFLTSEIYMYMYV